MVNRRFKKFVLLIVWNIKSNIQTIAVILIQLDICYEPIIFMAVRSPVHLRVCGMSQLHSTTGCCVISGHFHSSGPGDGMAEAPHHHTRDSASHHILQ